MKLYQRDGLFIRYALVEDRAGGRGPCSSHWGGEDLPCEPLRAGLSGPGDLIAK